MTKSMRDFITITEGKFVPPLTDTPEFKRWFAKSKVINLDGSPKIMYHGSNSDFGVFDHNFMYSGSGNSAIGSGFYFTSYPENADCYTDPANDGGRGGNIMPVYLSIQKPLFIDAVSGEVSGAKITLSKVQVKTIILSAPDIRNPNGILSNFGDIRYDGFARVIDDAIRMYAGGNAIAALRNDFFPQDHALWLKALSAATGHDGQQLIRAGAIFGLSLGDQNK